MQPVRKLAIPAVLTFVVLGTAALLMPSCGDDDGPVADGAQGDSPSGDGGAQPDLPIV